MSSASMQKYKVVVKQTISAPGHELITTIVLEQPADWLETTPYREAELMVLTAMHQNNTFDITITKKVGKD